jgi:hypothetical protein
VGKPYTSPTNIPVDPKVKLTRNPAIQGAQMDAGTFFNRLAMAMKDNPPYASSFGMKPFRCASFDANTGYRPGLLPGSV